MSLNEGRLGWLGVALESSYGVPVAIADYVPFTVNTLKGMAPPIPVDGAYQKRNKNFNSVGGKLWSEGDVEINLDTQRAGYFLIAAAGSVSDANVQSGVNDHTISASNSNTPKSLTITSDRVTDRSLYAGVVVDTLEIAAKDGLASLKAGLKGGFPQTTASGTATTASGTLLGFKDATFAFGATVAAAQNAANMKLSEFDFKLNNNASVIHRHGSQQPASINWGDLEVEVDFTVYFESVTDRNAYYNLSKQAASAQFTGAGLAGGYTESLKINLYQTRYDGFELETGLSNFFAEKGKLIAEYDNANSKDVEFVLRNSKTSY